MAELASLLRVARDVGVLPAGEYDQLEALREAAAKRTWGLYASMRPTSRP